MAIFCKAFVKNRGRGVYGSHRCTAPEFKSGLCKRHYDVLQRAAVKGAAYAAQTKNQA